MMTVKEATQYLEVANAAFADSKHVLDLAVETYGQKRVLVQLAEQHLAEALRAEQDAEDQLAKHCNCRSAPMGSTFCETCKHDLGCPVHNAAPCRRTT